jgi:hypothetical protein
MRMDIPHEKRFHFHDGSSVGTLEELRDKIRGISYQEFYRHVNAEKSDFANWVRYVLKEEELAKDLEKVSSIVETVEILGDFLEPRSVSSLTGDMQERIEEELDVHVPMRPDREQERQMRSPPIPATQEDAPFDVRTIEEHLRVSGTEEEIPRTASETIGAPMSEHILSQGDYTRLIVKDFMYGLVFGLIIGLILGRIISF